MFTIHQIQHSINNIRLASINLVILSWSGLVTQSPSWHNWLYFAWQLREGDCARTTRCLTLLITTTSNYVLQYNKFIYLYSNWLTLTVLNYFISTLPSTLAITASLTTSSRKMTNWRLILFNFNITLHLMTTNWLPKHDDLEMVVQTGALFRPTSSQTEINTESK
jgi:hypothetical protein